jgi:hypothetical protein
MSVKLITDHWYRGSGGNCLYDNCGRPQWDHRQAVDEWMLPPHWFVPKLRRPTWCSRCNRPFGHTVHAGSPARRRLWGRKGR